MSTLNCLPYADEDFWIHYDNGMAFLARGNQHEGYIIEIVCANSDGLRDSLIMDRVNLGPYTSIPHTWEEFQLWFTYVDDHTKSFFEYNIFSTLDIYP